MRRPPVHPHARGEQGNPFAARYSCSGSSPRAWGTASAAIRAAISRRFIPTRVGTAVSLVEHRHRRRFIPTRVGNRTPGGNHSSARSVHPHARGEQVSRAIHSLSGIGSSPRAWGTDRVGSDHRKRRRFIPTRVGNSLLRPPTSHPVAVHPHARGEQSETQMRAAVQTGSSPRAWGTDHPRRLAVAQRRFIPTRVGNRLMRLAPSGRRSVHPHARGEQLAVNSIMPPTSGSSPRAWGTGSLAAIFA